MRRVGDWRLVLDGRYLAEGVKLYLGEACYCYPRLFAEGRSFQSSL